MSFPNRYFCFQKYRNWKCKPYDHFEPLIRSSKYLPRTSSVELWCKGQEVQNHLINNACVIDEKAKVSEEHAKIKVEREKVDGQLCGL